MAVKVRIGDRPYEIDNYTVSEDATPLSAGDSTGGVGTITLNLAVPETGPVADYGPEWLIGEDIRLDDSYAGFTLGTVDAVSIDDSGQVLSLTCLSRLSDLNVFNIQAQPFVGTLGAAFEYYATLAGVTTGVLVDNTIATRPVVFPGFEGELWFHLKQMAAAQDCDISLVSGIILLRPIRARVAERGRDITRSSTAGGGPLAQTVEVYWYDSVAITDELVYPPGGWNPEVEVLNVNAGETAEYQLELSASVSSIQTPTMLTFVPSDYDATSVYTVVADDGLPVDPTQWADNGGSVEITINPDTKTLTVNLVGATNIPVASGGLSKSFSLALASDESGSRYSTLRIVGTGVSYTRNLKVFRTGVPESKTATVVGETIDNPFITDLETCYRAGTRAAKRWTGLVPSISGSVTAINRRGDLGQVSYLTYGQVQDFIFSDFPGPQYWNVEDNYHIITGGTYGDIKNYWYDYVKDDFTNQVFGNVQGARIWDGTRRRWFRIRSGTINPANIAFDSADDDLTHDDMEETYTGMTYGDVQNLKTDFTYRQDYLAGAYNG